MRYGLNEEGKRIDIVDSVKGEQYYCPLCESELIQKKGTVNMWHYAHKSLCNCDNWYVENEWTKSWLDIFNEECREVVIKNSDSDIKRIADIKYKKLVLKLQSKSLTGEEFTERVNYFSKEHNLVWLVDLREKDVKYRKTQKTYNYIWKHAYKFGNLDKFSKEFYLFFQLNDDLLIRVVWNKNGFKYFGGYYYNIEEFKKFLIKIADGSTIEDIVNYDRNKFNKEMKECEFNCCKLLEEYIGVPIDKKYNYKLSEIKSKGYSSKDILNAIILKHYDIEYKVKYKSFENDKHKVMYVFKIILNFLESTN